MASHAMDAPATASSSAPDSSAVLAPTTLFGALPTEIADTLCASLETHIRTGVPTLPIVSSSTEMTSVLVDLLLHKYKQAADLVELYCRRNVVSLAMYPPARRRAIVAAHNQELNQPGSVLKDDTNCLDEAQNLDENDVEVPSCPSAEEIPTLENVKQLENEMQELRHKLSALRSKKERVVRHVQQLDAATNLMSLARAPLALMATSDVNGTVQATASAVASLEVLQTTATKLQMVMEERTRQRDPKLDQITNVSAVEASQNKKRIRPDPTENERVTASGMQKFMSLI